MAQRKSLSDKMLAAYKQHLKDQAAAKAKAEAEAKKAAVAEQRRQDAEAKRAQRAADALARREKTANAQAVARALQGLDRREAQRKQEEETARTEKERQRTVDERRAKADQVEAAKARALEQTRLVEEKIEALGDLLVERDRDLQHRREETDNAFASGEADLFAEQVTRVLRGLKYLNRGTDPVRAAYTPGSRQLTLILNLPAQALVPTEREFRYVPARREIVASLRKEAEVQQIYRDLIARFTLAVADYAAQVTSPALVDLIAINGHVRATDRATGRAINPCLVTFLATREQFDTLVLDEPRLDPVRCLHHLNALVSPHPYDLEAVTPIVKYDMAQFKLVEEVGALGGLDSRPDLLAMNPYEFERLIQRLVEAMGFKAWRTQSSRDDGIDAVAINESPLVGGLCVIQAKRYKDTIPVEAVRALGGTMQEKKATTGIVVATSSFGKASYDFATSFGRIQLIDGRNLKALLREHLGIDVLIGLPKLPPGWERTDIS